ncbi:hypothetical protein [Nonomuraea sp. NPDC050643]|uniref:hypothetical protein n=1 Tax=Nonomuraea sp. NPDC050643 TaxID=3155660 RepID=UPI0033EA56F3
MDEDLVLSEWRFEVTALPDGALRIRQDPLRVPGRRRVTVLDAERRRRRSPWRRRWWHRLFGRHRSYGRLS